LSEGISNSETVRNSSVFIISCQRKTRAFLNPLFHSSSWSCCVELSDTLWTVTGSKEKIQEAFLCEVQYRAMRWIPSVPRSDGL
jgi:hypothetical protein